MQTGGPFLFLAFGSERADYAVSFKHTAGFFGLASIKLALDVVGDGLFLREAAAPHGQAIP